MHDPIEFYFDFVSPYAYLASQGIRRVADRFDRELIVRPVLLWAILDELEQPAPFSNRAKGDYLLMDMRRSAKFLGLPYVHPKIPVSSHLPARLFYELHRTDPGGATAFAFAAIDGLFVRGIDINDVKALSTLVDEIGFDGTALLEASRSSATKEMLVEVNHQAAARGVFGSPFYFVGDERFFGADRLPQLEWHLENCAQG